MEYDEGDDQWQSFSSEQLLADYIQRIPGIPLKCPHRCLTEEESQQIVSIELLLQLVVTLECHIGNRKENQSEEWSESLKSFVGMASLSAVV